ncbi:hypothetical protein LJC59_04080, partial [Desulfovibrio sp. OttesenSCG-928-A18]|nr:hypothetical protein [Desulfovibrio sp. OttesenSCG-928-A18]
MSAPKYFDKLPRVFLPADVPVRDDGSGAVFSSRVPVRVTGSRSVETPFPPYRIRHFSIESEDGKRGWVAAEELFAVLAVEALVFDVINGTGVPSPHFADQPVLILERQQDARGAKWIRVHDFQGESGWTRASWVKGVPQAA